MRQLLSLLHRWFGLFIAVFLFIAGLTGAIIAWDHELDGFINPGFYFTNLEKDQSSSTKTTLQLANELEQKHPELFVTFMPLELEPDSAFTAMVSARKTATSGDKPKLPFNQLAVNPQTGDIQAKREWGEISLARENLLPFIYKLHYSLHLPNVSGWEVGYLFMGIVGIVWILDCFIALSISFPSRAQWRKSFAFRWRSNSQKITFDLHRSGGVWVWLLLLIMAITSVSMNLSTQVVRPIVGLFSTLSPSPFETKAFVPFSEPTLTREAIVELAKTKATQESITAPLGSIFYSPDVDIYGVGFYTAGNDHGDVGLGNPWLYFDGKTGAYLGNTIPGQGSAGDIFMQLQFPLHSGRIAGTTGRIIVTALGLVVAMLSVTGIIIWARKRKSRRTIRNTKVSANKETANTVLIPSSD